MTFEVWHGFRTHCSHSVRESRLLLAFTKSLLTHLLLSTREFELVFHLTIHTFNKISFSFKMALRKAWRIMSFRHGCFWLWNTHCEWKSFNHSFDTKIGRKLHRNPSLSSECEKRYTDLHTDNNKLLYCKQCANTQRERERAHRKSKTCDSYRTKSSGRKVNFRKIRSVRNMCAQNWWKNLTHTHTSTN